MEVAVARTIAIAAGRRASAVRIGASTAADLRAIAPKIAVAGTTAAGPPAARTTGASTAADLRAIAVAATTDASIAAGPPVDTETSAVAGTIGASIAEVIAAAATTGASSAAVLGADATIAAVPLATIAAGRTAGAPAKRAALPTIARRAPPPDANRSTS